MSYYTDKNSWNVKRKANDIYRLIKGKLPALSEFPAFVIELVWIFILKGKGIEYAIDCLIEGNLLHY